MRHQLNTEKDQSKISSSKLTGEVRAAVAELYEEVGYDIAFATGKFLVSYIMNSSLEGGNIVNNIFVLTDLSEKYSACYLDTEASKVLFNCNHKH